MQKYSKIYVFCPNDAVTGGPDALHQLVFYLNEIGCEAQIVYYAYTPKHHFAVPNSYKNYVSSFILEKDVVDEAKSAVVLPENAVEKIRRFNNAKVYVWWLSVDNNLCRSSFLWKFFYFVSLPIRLIVNINYYKKHLREAILKTINKQSYSFKDEKKNVQHICASYYAYNYVSKRSHSRVDLCIEPISKFFLVQYDQFKERISLAGRKNVILYNPVKCGSFIKKMSKHFPDLNFLPLQSMNQEQLVNAYMSSKLYVDFGSFPGAERMPKEAALFGCSIITGRLGASAFYEDVPIPDEYKFFDHGSHMYDISQKIRQMLQTYELNKKDFDVYRKTIVDLEKNFLLVLRKLFYE